MRDPAEIVFMALHTQKNVLLKKLDIRATLNEDTTSVENEINEVMNVIQIFEEMDIKIPRLEIINNKGVEQDV